MLGKKGLHVVNNIPLSVRKLIPSPLRRFVKHAAWRVLDAVDWISGKGHLIPPRKLIFIGDGDFEKTGAEFLGHFTKLGGLSPQQRVLDVGSGIGRMAVPLIPFLSGTGRYDGMEIVPTGVEWCRKNITPRHPNFRFHLIDVYNLEYNPGGKIQAADYRFPFPDSHFDFTFLTSVFTHMLPADFENYVSEIARVTQTGGRCLSTFFLLNPESRAKIEAKIPFLDFYHQGPSYLTNDEKMPESAIAFPEEYVREVFRKNGFSVIGPVHYGKWCGREKFLSYQDILVFEKSL